MRTRQSSILGAYPAVAPVRTRQCPPCSPKDGPRGLYAPPLLSTTFSQAKGHICQAIHGFLGSLVGKALAAVVGAYPAVNRREHREEKKISAPPPAPPTPAAILPWDASFRRPGVPKAPRGAQEGRLPLEPRHLL